MSSQPYLPDRYAESFERPATRTAQESSSNWESQQIARHLGSQFQVVREIGRGGAGVVLLARDIALHRVVAIKVLRAELCASEEHREQFRREARLTARLVHPNIVPVYSFGEIADLVYMVMKYVQGESLADRMRREGTIAEVNAMELLRDLALALDYLHDEGVVHRDLKAENILIERGSGRAMLTDFGVALLRSADPVLPDAMRVFGTPHYMSPEQTTGDPDLDGRSDLYSLGVLGYYMLTGGLPFDGATFEALAAKHIAEPPIRLTELEPRLSPSLCAAIERCLRKEPDARWRRGRDLAAALADCAKRWRSGGRIGLGSPSVRARLVMALAMLVGAMSR
jgi:eukaryotic-like serine/threonine-protein kinase